MHRIYLFISICLQYYRTVYLFVHFCLQYFEDLRYLHTVRTPAPAPCCTPTSRTLVSSSSDGLLSTKNPLSVDSKATETNTAVQEKTLGLRRKESNGLLEIFAVAILVLRMNYLKSTTGARGFESCSGIVVLPTNSQNALDGA